MQLSALAYLYGALTMSAPLEQPRIQWYTEDYPPFNYQHNEELYGLAIDILRAAYQKLNWQLKEHNIMLLPWARVYKLVQEENKACVFSMTYTEYRAQQFNFIGLVIPNTVAIIAHNKSKISIEQLKLDASLRYGVVKNDIGHQALVSYGIPETQFVYLKTGLELVKMIDYKRVDVIAYGDAIANFQFKRANINPENYRILTPLLESKLGFACNKALPQQVLNQLDSAIAEVISEQPQLLQFSEY